MLSIYLECRSILKQKLYIYDISNWKLWHIWSAFLLQPTVLALKFEYIKAVCLKPVTWKFSTNIRVAYLPFYFRPSNVEKKLLKICFWKVDIVQCEPLICNKQSRGTIISLIIGPEKFSDSWQQLCQSFTVEQVLAGHKHHTPQLSLYPQLNRLTVSPFLRRMDQEDNRPYWSHFAISVKNDVATGWNWWKKYDRSIGMGENKMIQCKRLSSAGCHKL